MKIIKGFENEDIIVSDFGKWVGKNYIDYKSEYKNNQKIIKSLLEENKQLKEEYNKIQKAYESTFSDYQQLKDNWNKLKEFIVKEYYMYLPFAASTKSITILIDKMQELEQGSNSNE